MLFPIVVCDVVAVACCDCGGLQLHQLIAAAGRDDRDTNVVDVVVVVVVAAARVTHACCVDDARAAGIAYIAADAAAAGVSAVFPSRDHTV
jgi:hypothetical protein